MRGQVRLRALRRSLFGWGRGVYVLGMHRSGTSAVTRVINLMGLQLGDATDLIRAGDNPSGHWESARLTAVNAVSRRRRDPIFPAGASAPKRCHTSRSRN